MSDEEGIHIAYRDVLLLLALMFMTVAVLLIPMMAVSKVTSDQSHTPGLLSAELYWPTGSKSDLDLWLGSPGDASVGYSNKTGKNWALLRDDLGQSRTSGDARYEFASSLSIGPGEYAVNIHAYRVHQGEAPIPCRVIIRLARPGQPPQVLLKYDVQITKQGQELTVTRFALDDQGTLIQGSVTDLPKPLREE